MATELNRLTDLSERSSLESSIEQTPDQVYFSPDGTVGRVIVYQREFRYQALTEGLRHSQDRWTRFYAEHFVLRDARGLTQQLVWFRRQFGLLGDLMAQPAHVFKVTDGSFLHIGEIGNIPVVSGHYLLSPQGPRFLGLYPGSDHPLLAQNLTELPQPPDEVLLHTRWFQPAI